MIFVLGGKGFYGQAFCRVLDSLGREHRAITRENYHEYRGHSCDVLINANGNSSKILARRKPLEDFELSVKSVRASLVDFQFHTYLYLSSIDVYPNASPGAETHEEARLPAGEQSDYGFHKHLAEQCVQHGAQRWLIARLGGAVGPGLKKNALFDIVQGGPLWLDPESRLQFLATDDAARLVLALLHAGIRQEIYNVCGEGTIALSEAIERRGKPVHVTPGSPRVHMEINIQKLLRFGQVPKTRETVLEFLEGVCHDSFCSTRP
jgi:nucleoside-diphosphate-sugar epimerase